MRTPGPKAVIYLIIIILPCCFAPSGAVGQEPTIATCEGDQYYCIDNNEFELCVEITVEPEFTDPIDRFEIDWGDGTPITILPSGSNPQAPPHIYDLDGFYLSCVYETGFFITLTTYIINDDPVANIIPVTFRNPPNATFSLNPGVICAGGEACFNNVFCPSQGVSIVSWDYGDGSPPGLDNCHIYNQTGSYNITLTVENFCGTDTESMTLHVIEPPSATAQVTDGVVDANADTLVVCLDGGGIVDLEGSTLSENESSYVWNVSGSTINYDWIVDPPSQNNPTIDDPSLVFFNEGIYAVILTVNNACNQPDQDTLIFQAIDAVSLILNNPQDGCISLEYTPDPFNPAASYVVDGTVVINFPITLGIGMHNVSASLTNACGPQNESIEFEVSGMESVSITLPSTDTAVCLGTDPILLMASPEDGVWMGPHLIEIGDSTLFDPVVAGEHIISFKKGNGPCEDIAQIAITVDGGVINVSDYQKCSYSAPFTLQATPGEGDWSSVDCPSCITGDIFDPADMVALGLSMVSVSYDVSDASECATTASLTVSINDALALFAVSDTACVGDPIQVDFSMSNAAMIEWSIDGSNVGSPPFINLSEGAHQIQMISILGECRDTSITTIFLLEAPQSIDFTMSATEGCADLEVDLTNSNNDESFNYSWTINGQEFSTANSPGMITFGQGLSDTTYTIGLAIANGCGGDLATQDVLVYPRPIANIGTDLAEYCSGDTVYLANASYGSGEQFYWDYGNGLTSSDSLPIEVIYFTDTVPNIYPVTLIAINDCGVDTLVENIIVNPTDVKAFFHIDPTLACIADTICFESFSTLGADVIFEFGDGNTTTNFAPCHSYQQPGNYTITLKAFGCGFDSTTTNITILALPVAEIIGNYQACPYEDIQFAATTEEVVDIIWNFGDGSTSTLSNPTHSYEVPGLYTVTLTAYSLDSCATVDQAQVNIITPPAASISPLTDSLCQGDPISFVNTSSDFVSCVWDFGDGNFSNECNPEHIYATADNYNVTLIVTNSNGCSDTTSQLLNIWAEPIPAFTFTLEDECSPAQLILLNTSINADSYSWSFGNNEFSNETNPSTTYTLGDIYSINLIASNGLCSRESDTMVTIIQSPILQSALSSNTGCAPFEIVFGVEVNLENLDFSWDFDDGAFSFEQMDTHSFTDPGIYNVHLTVSNGPCKDSLVETITIFEPVLASTAITDVDCFGAATGEIDLTIDNGNSPFAIEWSTSAMTEDIINLAAGEYSLAIADVNNCLWFDTILVKEPDLIVPMVVDGSVVTCAGGNDGSLCIEINGGVGDYQIDWENNQSDSCLIDVPAGDYILQVTDGNNCTVESILTVYENPPINIMDEWANISCFGADDGWIELDTIQGGVSNFYNTQLVGPVSYDGGTSFPNLTEGEYQLTISDMEGCIFQQSYFIAEPDSLWLDIVEDSIQIGLGDSVLISADHNAATPFLNWQPEIGLNCSDCEDPWAKPLQDIHYVLTLIDENDCKQQDSIVIFVDLNRKFYIPNTFTPNGDGRNDIFRIRTRLNSILKVNHFRIFDRWGEMVFEAKDFRPQDENPEHGWDGRFKGELLAPDNFVYYCEIEYVDGVTEVEEGTILLVR